MSDDSISRKEEKRMSEYIIKETGYPGVIEQEIVQELVRCRDCKWYKTMYCKMDRWTDLVTIYVAKKDDYCSYGERRRDGKQ